MKNKIIVEIISFLFIALFVYAAASKLLDHEKFVVQIGQSPLLSHFARIAAWVIPVLEILIACLLVFSTHRLFGFFLAFTLMVIFTAYIIIITNYSTYAPCSCGGVLQNMGWTQHLILNVVFVMLALTAIMLMTMSEELEFQSEKY